MVTVKPRAVACVFLSILMVKEVYMVIFVTGGAGYIGSHTILELLNNGHDVVSIDNFVNSSIESLKKVEQITNKKIIT